MNDTVIYKKTKTGRWLCNANWFYGRSVHLCENSFKPKTKRKVYVWRDIPYFIWNDPSWVNQLETNNP